MYLLSIKLNGGLCNKLFCLFSACDIAIKNHIQLLEPLFGWKKKIKFSDIYDINYFNEQIRKYNNGRNIMIPIGEMRKYRIIPNKEDLWQKSEKTLSLQRGASKINKNSMSIIVLNALRLNKKNTAIINSFKKINNTNAIHIRIESDWINYSKDMKKNLLEKETILVNLNSLINMYKNKWSADILFTTGENQNKIRDEFKKHNINSTYFYDPSLEYEINAAINFYLCCKTNNFVGLSRSTFSNLISLKRHLLGKNNSFIYNYNNQLIERIDKGLYPEPIRAIKNKVNIL